MTCDSIKKLLTALVKGELDETSSEAIGRHISSCKACYRDFIVARLLDGNPAENIKEAKSDHTWQSVKISSSIMSEIDGDAENAAIIKISHSIIMQAIRIGASEILLDPGADCLRVMFRVSGVLHEFTRIPKVVEQPVMARFKRMASLASERARFTRHGKIPVRIENKDYDIDLAVIPFEYGERLVLQIPEAAT